MSKSRKSDQEVPPQALTIGEMARRAGCHTHQVRHFVESRRIREISRAGKLRIFSDDTFTELVVYMASRKEKKQTAIAS